MNETIRHALRFDTTLGGPNTWRISPTEDGIEIRATIGGVERLAEGQYHLPMRWRHIVKGATFVSPADTDRTLWVTQPVRIVPDVLPRELQLERASDGAKKVMSEW